MPPDRAADPRLRLALAWIAGFTLIDSSVVSLALPDIARAFDRTVGDLAWIGTAYLLALAATLLIAGRLNDRYGSRHVLGIGAVAFAVMTAACGLAPSYELLIAARVGQGIAGGILYTVSLAIVVTAFPPDRRATAIGIYFTSGALGAVLGPPLGGFLTDVGGWRLVFLAQLPLPALVAIGSWTLLPAGGGRPRPMDLPGLATASVLLVAVMLAVLELAAPGMALVALVAAVVAVVALVVFVVVERRAAEPAVNLAIFGNARFVSATLAGAGAWFAIMSSVTYSALYLQLGRGMSAADAGLLLLTGPMLALVFFPYAGRFVRWMGVDPALRLGLALLVATAAGMLTWGASTPIWWVVVVLTVQGAGIAIALVASADDAMAQFRPEEAGTGSALFNSLRQLGAALGVAVPAVAFELVAAGDRSADAALGGSTAAFAVRFAVLCVPLAVALAVGRRGRRRRGPAEMSEATA